MCDIVGHFSPSRFGPLTPTFLATKLYIDFTEDSEIEFALDDLLRHLLNAPLYQKPEIGKDPFRPLDKARPEKTADGLRNVMADVAAAYDKVPHEYIRFLSLMTVTKLRRFTLEKYLAEAEAKGLIRREGNLIYITGQGRSYLDESGIVDA